MPLRPVIATAANGATALGLWELLDFMRQNAGGISVCELTAILALAAICNVRIDAGDLLIKVGAALSARSGSGKGGK